MRCACTHEMAVTMRRVRLELAGQESLTCEGVEVFHCPNCGVMFPTDTGRAVLYGALGLEPDAPAPRCRIFIAEPEVQAP